MDYKARKKSSAGLPQRSRSASSKRTQTPTRKKSSAGASTPMDKTSMLVMEANEISTYLQKDYVSPFLFFILMGHLTHKHYEFFFACLSSPALN